MPADRDLPAPPRTRLTPATSAVGLVSFLVLATLALHLYRPAPPLGFEVDVVFPRGHAGMSEPLVVTGETGSGEFFFVRYRDESTAMLGYERWGSPSTFSLAFDVRPGERRRLRLELPMLTHVRGGSRDGGDELRASVDGTEVFRLTTHFNLRKSSHVYFGENPIGGGTCDREFSGWIHHRDGRALHGNARHVFSWRERIGWWFVDGKWQFACVLLASVALARTFHTLLASEATPCRGIFAAFVVLRDVRAKFKTAWRFCFSPHDLQGSGPPPPERHRTHEKNHGECEKCGLGALWQVLRSSPGTQLSRAAGAAVALVSTHRWFAGTAALCSGAFFCVLTGGTGRLFFEETFGNFYDYQAAALLHGRLDVPEPAVSGEAFIVGGKYYGYFGLTPALLRLPLVIFDLGFGWWSRTSMLVAFIAALVAAYFVLRAVLRLVAPEKPAPAAWMSVVFSLNVGLGSTLFFLGSRAYIYHEATLWGATFALAATGCTLRFLATPHSRWWLPALICGLLSLHARPPTGLFALVLLSVAALAIAWRGWRERDHRLATLLRRGLALPVACFLGVLSFNGLSYLKFKTFDGAPLQYHVQYHPERLARIQGKNFHVANFGYDFSAYAWRPNFELRPSFPYFYITGKDPAIYPQSRMDLAEPTLALPYAMPALVFLAIVALPVACARWRSLPLPALVVLVAIGPMAAALFTAVAVSQRYTADFCPWLIGLAAIGLMAVENTGKAARRAFLTLVAPLTLAAILITAAITIHYQGTGVWGVPDDVTQRYRNLRKKADSLFGVTNHEP